MIPLLCSLHVSEGHLLENQWSNNNLGKAKNVFNECVVQSINNQVQDHIRDYG